MTALLLFLIPFLIAGCQQAPRPALPPGGQEPVVPTQLPTKIAVLASVTPTATSAATRTAPATPPELSTPTPVPPPTVVSQNAFAVGFSADGSLLTFNSDGAGLVPEDQNQVADAYLYHTADGAIEWVQPAAQDPTDRSAASRAASLSASGRYLLFGARSNAPQPAADHYNFILLRDLATGAEQRIDIIPFEQQFNAEIVRAHLSPDGQTLALEAVRDQWNILLYNLPAGAVTPVSIPAGGGQANGSSYEPVFSPDGQTLAFVSDASNLVEGDTRCSEAFPQCGDVFVYDIPTGKLERIPARIQFTMGNPYPNLTVSNNARYLAWTELEDDADFRPVIRLHDRQTGQTETICAGEGYCSGHAPAISNDGRWLAFASIGQWKHTKPGQVYLLDRQSGQITLISATPKGRPGDGWSGMIQLQSEGFSSDVRISGDGRYVAFSSQAANLLPEGVEKNQCYEPIMIGAYTCYDLFLYDRQAETLTWVNRPAAPTLNSSPNLSTTPTVSVFFRQATPNRMAEAVISQSAPTVTMIESPDKTWRAVTSLYKHPAPPISGEACRSSEYG